MKFCLASTTILVAKIKLLWLWLRSGLSFVRIDVTSECPGPQPNQPTCSNYSLRCRDTNCLLCLFAPVLRIRAAKSCDSKIIQILVPYHLRILVQSPKVVVAFWSINGHGNQSLARLLIRSNTSRGCSALSGDFGFCHMSNSGGRFTNAGTSNSRRIWVEIRRD